MEYSKKVIGFELTYGKEGSKSNRKPKDLTVTYIYNDRVKVKSFFYPEVDEEKVKTIQKMLEDYTRYNREKAQQVCQAIALVDIIFFVEDVIYKK